MKLALSVFVACVILVFSSTYCLAGGANAYPNGTEDFWCGAAPPPGLYYFNYDLWYSAHKYTNSDNHELETGPFDGFKIDLLANVSRIVYMTEVQLFGANWGMQLLVPVIHKDVETDVLGSDHKTGIGDIIFDPFILSWHSETLHVCTGVDIYVPTGDYDKGALANISTNVWTIEPVVGITYVLPEDFSVSAKLMYDFNTKNNDYIPPKGPESTLKPGQEFHFDYSLSKKFGNGWQAGLVGYYYLQTSADELNGGEFGDPKGEALAIGPGVEYNKDNLWITLKSYHEVYTENRPRGMSLWLKVIYAF